jgi:hypothetical protein
MNCIAEKTAKAEIVKYLQQQRLITVSSVLISEYSVNRSNIRADLVLANTRSLHGIEIKTDADSLKRVGRQLEGYSRYFTHVTFAVSPRHLPKALELLPNRVGIWVIKDDKITVVRRAKKTQRQKSDLVHMMHVADLKSLIRNEGLNYQFDRRAELSQLALQLPKNTLAVAALKSIRARYKEVSSSFLESFNCDKDVKQIAKLSRYFQRRENTKRQEQKFAQIWLSWNQFSYA